MGCANGPVPYLMSLNPKLRRQWEEDERYQPTLHRQLAEVRALRDAESLLSEAEQRHWCGEFKYILEHHENPILRAEAVKTLAVFSVAEANESLQIAMNDADADVRIAACAAWGTRTGQEAMEQLAQALRADADLDVRIAAARELGHFDDRYVHRALGLALEPREDPALQYRAVESLKRASGRNYGNDLAAWRQFAAGEDPGPEYTPSLAERLHELF